MHRLLHRQEAGELLGERLSGYADRRDVVVLALPRGGVPIAREISQILHIPMDVFVVRKLGAPGFEELAMGAVAIGGAEYVNEDVVGSLHISREDIDKVVRAARIEMARRELAYRGERPPVDVRGRAVILVDDGIATGSTMRVTIAALRRLGPSRIIVATGVAPASTAKMLESEADEFISLITPNDFRAVGQFYESFPQLSDEDVRAVMDLSLGSGRTRGD